MPRYYVPPLGAKRNCNYPKEKLEKAVELLSAKKISPNKAVKQFCIPKTTLLRRLKGTTDGKVRKYGGQAVLSEIEEQKLIEGINTASKWGYPFEATNIRYLVKSYLDIAGRKEKRFSENLPGVEWFNSFMKRHKKELSIRMPDYIKMTRAQIEKPQIAEFFENLQKTISGVPPENILNFDETAFVDDPGRSRVVVRRGSKRVENIMDTSKSSTSVMFAGTASGTVMPPFIVYKAQEMWNTWTEGGPPHARYASNKSGWFDEAMFCNWFKTVALPYLKHLPGGKTIIGDNVASHLSYEVIRSCKSNQIDFVLFPPNCTHLLQPLDLVFFRQLKPKWRGVLKTWKKNKSGVLPKDQFGKLLFSAMKELKIYPDTVPANSKYFTCSYLVSSFKAAGIFPFNPKAVLKRIADVPNNQDQKAVEAQWTMAIQDYMKEQRFSSQKSAPRRRKKIQTEPGKSVTAEVETSEDSVILDNPGNTDNESSEGEESGTQEEDEPIVANLEDQEIAHNFDDQEMNIDTTLPPTYEPGMFVMAAVYGKKQYVRQIMHINDESPYTIHTKFLRPYQNRINEFIFPPVDDYDDIIHEQIIRILAPPAIVRGKHLFYDLL